MANFDVERRIELQQIESRLEEIRATLYTNRRPIGSIKSCVTGKGLGPERMPTFGWKPFELPAVWGGYDETTWFRMKATVPKAWKGHQVVALIRAASGTFTDGLKQLSAPGEALLFKDGKPYQGLDINRDEVVLTERAAGGESWDLAIEAVPSVRFPAEHLFKYADLAIKHPAVWDTYWDFAVPVSVFKTLDPNTQHARRLLELLARCVRLVDLQHVGEPAYYDSLPKASRALQKGLKDFEKSEGLGKLILTGHSHIDTAWLWPLRETRRKVGRTYSTVLNLMERYPEYHFSASQPELYMYVKEHFPEIWKGIKKRVKEGRWEPCGAPWVEPDNLMPSGESLIRQFLYGNRFFQEEFGMRSRIAWLPDAFGYPWTMPQILKKCGIDCFVTTKIDWSMFTDFPYSFFQWQGLDGSRIPALMPPLNYNGNPVPEDCVEQWKRFKQKEKVEELIFPFGWGDGGGGPTMEMLEHGKRMKNIVGIPRCEFGRTQDSVDHMFEQCPPETLPVYNNELYLELHRACQTTQARTKRNNRKAEVLLHDTEFISALALLNGGKYDAATLWKAWRIILTNQFHDILPGSSINEVYETADKEYADAQGHVRSLQDAAVTALVGDIDTSGEGTPVIVFNTLSWVRDSVVTVKTKLPRGTVHVVAPNGHVMASQRVGSGTLVFEAEMVPPLGYAVYRILPGKAAPHTTRELSASPRKLENAELRLKLDTSGRFVSLYDKLEEREIVAPGEKANEYLLYEDRPHLHDAWDIDHNFEEELTWTPGKAESMEVVEEGPVRAVIRVVRKTERSAIIQDITLYALHSRVEVVTHIDWNEKRAFLKVAFPVAIHSHRATYDIQYGAIERATHDSTAHDRARFEVPAHRWADLSEGNYGVSLLNDCKYGYDVKDNLMRLSLLRAPVDPDEHADEGKHTMTYAVYPHGGDWRNGTVQEGLDLNVPLVAHVVPAKTGAQLPVASFASTDADNVLIDHVKKAEDSDAVIVRLYEAYGQRGKTKVTFGQTPKNVALVDMMEEHPKVLKRTGNSVTLDVLPWEIHTLRVTF